MKRLTDAFQCSKCEYAKARGMTFEGRKKKRVFYCQHPNQKSIITWYKRHIGGKNTEIGYVGRGNQFADKPEISGCPAWCPRLHDKIGE